MLFKKTVILKRKDIEKLIDINHVLGIVEKAYRAQGQGKVQMPAKIYLHLDKYAGDFRAMPAYIEGSDACGIKWVNVHPNNKEYGLPAVMAIIILNDPKTGFPLAVMDGTYITSLRTAAAGGIAAKHLANKNSSSVSLVGCGVQARAQIAALKELFKIKLVKVCDLSESQAINFIEEMKFLGLKMNYYPDIKECLSGSDIVVTTTPARKPIIKSEWIGSGVHINAIGADAKGKEELAPALLKRAKIIVDDITQAVHSGEINVPISKKIFKASDVYAEIGEIVAGKKAGRTKEDEITVFDSTGLAILDVAVANYVYKKALKDIAHRKTEDFIH